MRPATTVVRYDARGCAGVAHGGSVAGASPLGTAFWLLISLGLLLGAVYGVADVVSHLTHAAAQVLGVLG